MTGHRGDNVAAGVVPVVVGPLLQPPPPEGGVSEARARGGGAAASGTRGRTQTQEHTGEGEGRGAQGTAAAEPVDRWGQTSPGPCVAIPPPSRGGRGPPVGAWDTWRGDTWVGVSKPVTQGSVAVVMRGRTRTEEGTEGTVRGGLAPHHNGMSWKAVGWWNGPRETVPSIGAFAEGIPTRIASPIPSDSVRGL